MFATDNKTEWSAFFKKSIKTIKIMMKNLFLVLLALLSLTACDNSPEFHGLTQQEKEEYAQGITYQFTY